MISNRQLVQQAIEAGNLKLAAECLDNPLFLFEPRPDRTELLDQQTGFYEDQGQHITVGLGGNGSGKLTAVPHE